MVCPVNLKNLARRSSPPERLFGLTHGVTSGQSDVMQFVFGPMAEFLALMPTLGPQLQLHPEPG
jgi:hypothetical protein